jgi:hypothetical protein
MSFLHFDCHKGVHRLLSVLAFRFAWYRTIFAQFPSTEADRPCCPLDSAYWFPLPIPTSIDCPKFLSISHWLPAVWTAFVLYPIFKSVCFVVLYLGILWWPIHFLRFEPRGRLVRWKRRLPARKQEVLQCGRTPFQSRHRIDIAIETE